MSREKEEHNIFSNLLTRVFNDSKKIRGMISCLGRNNEIKTTTSMIYINKFNKSKNTYDKKIDSCKLINLKDAITYLKKEQEQESPKHQKTRETWLKLLLYINENIELLQELHKNPNETQILEELEEKKVDDIKCI